MPEWWKELPERDCEYVTYYPVNIRPLGGSEVQSGQTDGRYGFGVYIHVPFCDQICPFCNYNKFRSDGSAASVVNSMVEEIRIVQDAVSSDVKKLDFVYLGGGTPSTLTPEQVTLLLSTISERFSLDSAEVSLECHPTHGFPDKLKGFRVAGVDRISFGVQSLDDEVLKRIGSYHDRETAFSAVANARRAGFENVAFDLMFLLPGQELEQWETDIRDALSLEADHISTYRMVLDPVGVMGRQIRTRRLPPQGEEALELAMAQLGLEILQEAGYGHYGSCSSAGFDFARPGRESKYEIAHRAAPQCEYAAVGPGAVGHMNGYVYWNIHTVAEYQHEVGSRHLPVLAGRRLSLSDRQSRYAVLGVKHLRLPLTPFQEMFGKALPDVFGREIAHLEEHEVVTLQPDALHVTPRGVHYMDNISKAFFDAENYRLPQPYKPELQMMSMDLFGAPDY